MSSKAEDRLALHGSGAVYWHKLASEVRRDRWLYVLLAPGVIYFLVFKYLPMFGIVIAFENYVPFTGVLGSEWVGTKWFNSFFGFPAWTTYLANTLILSVMNLVFYFPAPIILALMLNEMRLQRYKRLLQTMLYVPHFISIVIVVSITFVMFGPSGIVYKATESVLGYPIKYMGSPDTFRWMIIGQTIWKETGWGTIIFLAALTNVDTQLYEAAMVDGAGRIRRLWHITLPAIRSTIVLMLILRMGSMLDTGYDHLILMANAMNRKASQTLDVFVYQQGIQSGQFSYASAIGLMKSIVSVTLVVSSNKIAHLLGEQGLY
ncbi:MAG: sugar ABC transporter permease [Clostridia bacterium]|nr:sugar ABC transporter permease [Clostridia bacterium]